MICWVHSLSDLINLPAQPSTHDVRGGPVRPHCHKYVINCIRERVVVIRKEKADDFCGVGLVIHIRDLVQALRND